MRAALWFLALFGVAVAIALFAGNNQGTVTLFWPPWRVDLSLNLVLDGTGVDELGATAPERKSVKERVQDFFDTTLHYNGNTHEPYYLCVEWGSLKFLCRLETTTIKYTAFERNGDPLRAELNAEVDLIARGGANCNEVATTAAVAAMKRGLR